MSRTTEPARRRAVGRAIARWNRAPLKLTMSLHTYLGWTWDEYARWVESDVLPPKRKGAK